MTGFEGALEWLVLSATDHRFLPFTLAAAFVLAQVLIARGNARSTALVFSFSAPFAASWFAVAATFGYLSARWHYALLFVGPFGFSVITAVLFGSCAWNAGTALRRGALLRRPFVTALAVLVAQALNFLFVVAAYQVMH